MVNLVNRDAIDTLAAELFGRDHPDRVWSGERAGRFGAASAFERAIYRGFASGQMAVDRRGVPQAAIAAEAAATAYGPRAAFDRRD